MKKVSNEVTPARSEALLTIGLGFFLGYHSLGGTWTIRPDGNHFKDSPHRLAAAGKFAKVPLMIGDMRDEGTLFSQINQLTILTDSQFKDYFQNEFWPHATDANMAELMQLYPQDPTKGSPYGTGLLNAISPQYKRLASVTGDATFEVSAYSNIPSHAVDTH
jgi:acetylcholinesterase